MKITVGIADDQQLFLKSLRTLINTFDSFDVIVDALNGEELVMKLKANQVLPAILLIDVNMPVMNGPKTVEFISALFPEIKFVALSMKDDDISVLKMIKAGCCAYLLKDIHPTELETALNEIYTKGYHNADVVNINYRQIILKSMRAAPVSLNEREIKFLNLACSDLTYQQIADKMCLAERTIDGYRASLFEKFHVKSRVGLALEAVRLQLVTL